jgi:hypothetical protein
MFPQVGMASGAGKAVERDSTWSCPYEHLKFPQQRRRFHGVRDSELR